MKKLDILMREDCPLEMFKISQNDFGYTALTRRLRRTLHQASLV